VIFLVIGLVREAREQGLELAQIIQLVPYVLPDALRFTMPATILLSACMVYGRMSSANEVTALKSAGISPTTILWPAVILSFLLSLTTVWLNDAAVSWGRDGIQRIVIESVEEIAYGMLRTQRSYTSKTLSIVVKRVDGKRLVQPVITLDSKGKAVVMTAEEAELRGEPDKGLFTIICRNGMIDIEGRGRILFPNDVFERSVPLDKDKTEFSDQHPSYMPMHVLPIAIRDIRKRIDDHDDECAAKAALQMMTGDASGLFSPEWNTEETLRGMDEQRLFRLQTESPRRWSNGFSCLCFVMVGAPLAMRLRNADFLTTFFLCFFPILLVYYPLLMFGVDHAKAGRVPPITVWLGNVVLFAAAWQLIWRVKRY
jgi:lipopolysaccharide export system permease protein